MNLSTAELLSRLSDYFSNSTSQILSGSLVNDIPSSIGRFRINREIGSGGFGVVFHANDESIGREVAIKVPRQDTTQGLDYQHLILQEARAAGALDHPGIIPVYEVGNDAEILYIVSAYCDGPDLMSWLQRQDAMPSPKHIAIFCAKLTEAVAFAHDRGIIHRDIKPSNVLMSSTEKHLLDYDSELAKNYCDLPLSKYEPRLTDFGLAKKFDEPLEDTRSSLIVGTPLYMAPEQLLPDFGPVTAQTDIFSLGLLLVELCTGQSLFSGKTYREIIGIFQSDAPLIAQLVPNAIPDNLRAIILRCLATVPSRRFASAQQLADDLCAFADGRTVLTQRPSIFSNCVVWCQNPSRTREACVVVIGTSTVLGVWILYAVAILWSDAFPGDSPRQAAIQGLGVLVFFNIPAATLAYLGLNGKTWSIYGLFILLLIGHVAVPALIVGDVIGLLDPVYGEFPYFKKSFHFLVMMLGILQLTFVAIGIYAKRLRSKYGAYL